MEHNAKVILALAGRGHWYQMYLLRNGYTTTTGPDSSIDFGENSTLDHTNKVHHVNYVYIQPLTSPRASPATEDVLDKRQQESQRQAEKAVLLAEGSSLNIYCIEMF